MLGWFHNVSWELRPGGAMATRDIHFIWLVDASTSMQGAKIQSLNYAIANALPEMRRSAADNPYARVLVRCIRFATHAEWIIPEPVPLESFQWSDIVADGETAMGEALMLVADELETLQAGGRFFPAVLILVTDGYPTDGKFEAGLRRLMSLPLGRSAVRLAIAIGSDADLGCLEDFIGNPEIRPLQAGDSDALAQMISFASVSGIESSSTPGSRLSEAGRSLRWVAAPAAKDDDSSKVIW
jgi:uncharacterized protein YegL